MFVPISFISFRDTIVYIYDSPIIEDVHDALYSKKKTKHLVQTEDHGDNILDGGSQREKLRSNFMNKICNLLQEEKTLGSKFL